ncbi:MAG: polysaccharide deacetylase family protein [Acidobacteriota bacterium]
MKTLLLAIVLVGLLIGAVAIKPRATAALTVEREVAVTFDDLPSPTSHDVQTLREMTERLLRTLKSNRVPVIGFVNERKLYQDEHSQERIAILKLWIDAGFDLGNHTYSHLRLYDTPLERFKEDVIMGERVSAKLLAAKGGKLRYFRHPTLSTGRDLATKRAFEQFLSARGYSIAPVTIDNSEWILARVYAEAKAKGDTALMKRVAAAYTPYMEEMTAFYEKLSQDTLGYEVKQILLVHANGLNADHFGEVIEMYRRRGYRFVTLDEALKDRAYSLKDEYVGPVGISWLQRWAITKGGEMRAEPSLPETMKEFDSASSSGSAFKTRTGKSQ